MHIPHCWKSRVTAQLALGNLTKSLGDVAMCVDGHVTDRVFAKNANIS